jgi:hypothetical protein
MLSSSYHPGVSWVTTIAGTCMTRVDLMAETCRLGIWIKIALKTSSLNMNRTVVRMVRVGMVMKDLLTLGDVKQTACGSRPFVFYV